MRNAASLVEDELSYKLQCSRHSLARVGMRASIGQPSACAAPHKNFEEARSRLRRGSPDLVAHAAQSDKIELSDRNRDESLPDR